MKKMKKFMKEEMKEGENPEMEMKKMSKKMESVHSGEVRMDESEKRASKVAQMMKGKK